MRRGRRATVFLSLLVCLSVAAITMPAFSSEPPRFPGLTQEEAASISISNRQTARIVPHDFGTATEFFYNITPADFQARLGDYANFLLSPTMIQSLNPPYVLISAPVHLPSGTMITSLTVHYWDSTPTTGMSVGLYQNLGAQDFDLIVGWSDEAAFDGGPGSITFPTAVTVNNATTGYMLHATVPKDVNGYTGIVRVSVGYKRQVSNAPAVATFADVPTNHGFFKFVEALAAAGITGGCGGGNYCPNSPVTRGQMAVFLATALGLHWAP